VILVDGEIEEALAAAADYSARTGAFLVEDSKDIDTCEGAATIGLELAASFHSLDAILISLWRRGDGNRRRLCDEMPASGCRGAVRPTRAGARHDIVISGRSCGRPRTSQHHRRRCGWALWSCRKFLDDLSAVATDAFLVSEESIKKGMRLLYRCSGLIVEPGGRARHRPLYWRTGTGTEGGQWPTILCGGGHFHSRFRTLGHAMRSLVPLHRDCDSLDISG